MASNAAIEGVAGAAAGMVALVATYPLMTVTYLPFFDLKFKDWLVFSAAWDGERPKSRGRGAAERAEKALT